jgi:hypothetical protein
VNKDQDSTASSFDEDTKLLASTRAKIEFLEPRARPLPRNLYGTRRFIGKLHERQVG